MTLAISSLDLILHSLLHRLFLTGLAGLSAILALICFFVIYNVFFHPLARFPGPKLSAASAIPVSISIVKGKYPHDLARLHEQYGEVVRTEPNALSIISPGAWKDIHSTVTTKKFKKTSRPTGRDGVDVLFTIEDDELHGRHRSVLSHAFSDRALRGQEARVLKHSNHLIEKLKTYSEAGAGVNLVEWLDFTTFDLVGDLAFGESFGCLDNSGYTPYVENTRGAFKEIAFFNIAARFSPLEKILMRMAPKRVIQRINEHNAMAADKVGRRIAKGANEERKDFWSYVLSQKENSFKLSGDEMELTASTLIAAGSITTAETLAGAVYFLCLNPTLMSELCNEIRSAFATQNEINIISTGNLRFLHACLMESMRLYTPVPFGLHRIAPKEGAMVAGHFIPGGTVVTITQYPAFTSTLNFASPFTFAPERWLPNPPEKYANDRRDIFQPFGMGPRNCIGKNLAWAEMKLILTNLLWNFDIELEDGVKESWDPKVQKAFIFWHKPELRAKLRKRS